MKYAKELAVIYRTVVNIDNSISYKPVQVVEGVYDPIYNVFIDINSTPYSHIVNTPNSYGFALRRTKNEYKKNYPKCSLLMIKKKILRSAKRFKYMSGEISHDNADVPVIICFNINLTENHIFLDTDTAIYYSEYYPDFLSQFLENSLINVKLDTSKQNNDTFSETSFKNTSNERKYPELVITGETTKNDKKYVLARKRKM